MKKNRIIYILLTVLILFPQIVSAQKDRALIRQGNRIFHNQEYEKAEATYRKAVAANPSNPEAQYNLGCALMAQQKDSLAVLCFQKSAQTQSDKLRRAQAFHNIGVIFQQKKQFAEAIEAYKESLRNNPKDDETRYNLALCMKQNKNQNKNQNKDKNRKNDQQKDKNKDKNEDNKDDKNKDDNKKNDKQDKQEQQTQQPKEQMSKENAEQLLEAAKQHEQATQQKLKKAQSQPRRSRHQNNW